MLHVAGDGGGDLELYGASRCGRRQWKFGRRWGVVMAGEENDNEGGGGRRFCCRSGRVGLTERIGYWVGHLDLEKRAKIKLRWTGEI